MRRNLEHTAQPTGSATSCRVSFPGASVGLIILFQVGGLVSRIFTVAWLVGEWLSAFFIACFWEGQPTESGQFQVLPKAIALFVCCTKCSNLGRNCYTSHLTVLKNKPLFLLSFTISILCVHVCHSLSTKGRGPLVWVNTFLLPQRIWRGTLDGQVWWQTPLPAWVVCLTPTKC